MADLKSEDYLQKLFAERIGGSQFGKGTEIYKFEKIKRAKRQVIADFPERKLLDFGIGENDEMADVEVRAVLAAEANQLENRGYADNGIQDYKDAAARFTWREFNVRLNSQTEINHCIGTKTALSMIPAAFINPGDITLMTVPGYPVAGTHTRYYGGEVYRLPLLEKNNFLPDIASIPDAVLEKAKLLVLNYPNSPTGALASEKFFENVVAFAKKHEIVVIHDAAHIMLTYDREPLSFLQIEGARDVGVELHSMSKGFDMIGWRLGFVCGNERIVHAFADVKDNCDSGQFMAIQKAGAVALDNPEIPQRIRTKYQRRLRKLISVLGSKGFNTKMSGGSYFLYVKAPTGISNGAQFANAEECSQFLIRNRSICTVPWDDAGAYLRFSVTYHAPDEASEDEMMRELVSRLGEDTFTW